MKTIKGFYSHYIRDIIEVMRKPVVSVLPGHLSFFLLLSFIPLSIIFAIIANMFSISFDNFGELVKNFPIDPNELFNPTYSSSIVGIGFFLLIVSALYLASRATKAIILTANNIYDVRKNGMKDIIKSILITLLIIFLIIFITVILILGERLLNVLLLLPDSGRHGEIVTLINIFKWPISLFLIFFLVKAIYILTPNKRIKGKTVNKGSLFTTISWSAVTFIYSYYIPNFSSYDSYYGSASSIVVLMLWLYIISELFVIGMIINSLEEKKEQEIEKQA